MLIKRKKEKAMETFSKNNITPIVSQALSKSSVLGGLVPMDVLVGEIAKALVNSPQNVVINKLNGNYMTVLELRVAKEDLGKVIGKNGRTAQAIRTLLTAVSSKNKERIVLEIIE